MSKNLLYALMLVSSFALYYVVINPLYTGIGSLWQPEKGIVTLRDSNAQYDAALAKVQSLSEQADALRGQYEAVSPEVKEKMATMVPESIEPVRLMSEVNTIANGTGLIIHDLNYSEIPASAAGTKGSYAVSFTVNTSYIRFKELMRNYETSLRLFTIKSVVFNVPTVEGENINFQVRLETSYMK